MNNQHQTDTSSRDRFSNGVDKVLAVDWGSKRVGLAIGSSDARLASPLMTEENTPDLLWRLQQLCQKEQVTTVVVGLPRGLEGQETPQTAVVRQFADQLASALDAVVKLQDEALTSQLALKRGGNKDAEAAAVILQDYLDSL